MIYKVLDGVRSVLQYAVQYAVKHRQKYILKKKKGKVISVVLLRFIGPGLTSAR